MPKESKSYKKWLKTAYFLFAELGPDGINIKALSEACGLPRPNFYYHFPDKEYLIDQLLKMHLELELTYEHELKEKLHTFLPDLYEILVDYKPVIKFHWQLFRNRHVLKYNHVYLTLNNTSGELILPKFKDYYKLEVSGSKLKSIWGTLIDSWYSRLDFDKFTVEELCAISEETMNAILEIIRLRD